MSIECSKGNKKVGKDTIIFNMCSATDCPSRLLGLCMVQDRCYAMKAERQYPSVLPYRRRQEHYWHTTLAEDIVKDILDIVKRNKREIRYFRFSEAGDFDDQEDIDKMSTIANILDTHVRLYGYTARRDLDFSNISSNMIVNGSGFMVSNKFTAVEKAEDGSLVCPGNCRQCNLCKEARGLDIKVIYH